MNLEDFGDRLREERKRLGFDQLAFATAAGVSRNSQIAYESGKTAPPVDYLLAVGKLGVRVQWLFEGVSPPEVKDFLAERYNATKGLGANVGASVNLPEFDISYAMGGGALIADHADATTVAFPRDWLRPIIRGSFDQVFIARGEGDSMQPTLLDGDITIIDTAQRALNSQDRLWAIQYGELGMIKRLRAQPDGGILVLSDNPTVAAFTAYDGEVQLIGRVVWIGRRV